MNKILDGHTLAFLRVYSIIYLVFCVFLVLLLKSHHRLNYSYIKLSQVLTGSNSQKITDDPCMYSINGEPLSFVNNYVKVFIHCKDRTSSNTVALPALYDKTVSGLLIELGRIHGYKVEVNSSTIISLGNLSTTNNFTWYCTSSSSDYKKITDYSREIVPTEIIDCYYQ